MTTVEKKTGERIEETIGERKEKKKVSKKRNNSKVLWCCFSMLHTHN